MEKVSFEVQLVFGITSVATIALLALSSHKSIKLFFLLCGWTLIQALVAWSGFYTNSNAFPPRFWLMVVPPIFTIVVLFTLPSGRKYLDSLNMKTLMLLHIVRIPVELVLFYLCEAKTVPMLMTFEGRNFDILSGISAPIIFYLAFHLKILGPRWLILWNFICLGLLLNIVINAVLSAPFQFQRFAFDQPNIAVLYFPFNWLPSVIVPIVLLSHLVVLRQLTQHKTEPNTTIG